MMLGDDQLKEVSTQMREFTPLLYARTLRSTCLVLGLVFLSSFPAAVAFGILILRTQTPKTSIKLTLMITGSIPIML